MIMPMSTKYEDNFGFYCIKDDDPEELEFFCHIVAQSEPIICLRCGEGLGLLENWLGCTLPESQQEGGLSVGAVGPQGASQWRDYPRRRVRARSFAP
jgi:hypothetical protein